MVSHRLETAESVTLGHPDKIADQISDAVLDAYLEQDPTSRVACETMINSQGITISGEVTSTGQVSYEQVVRKVLSRIGDANVCNRLNRRELDVIVRINQQSPDISAGVDTGGAGDQGVMVGYACRDTPELMPLPVMLARHLTAKLTELRNQQVLKYLLPDGKAQVTVEYEGDKPLRVHTVLLSTQHAESALDATKQRLAPKSVMDLIQKAILPIVPKEFLDQNTQFIVNPAGRFVVGGIEGDTGLTGRKIVADAYGPYVPHGGGAFSGKDATKVDRCAALAIRYIAKNIVAAKLAKQCTVHVAYAIGQAEPVSLSVDTHGTGRVDEAILLTRIRRLFPLTPRRIIKYFKLHRPIFSSTTVSGPFGRTSDLELFTWEKTDKAKELLREIRRCA